MRALFQKFFLTTLSILLLNVVFSQNSSQRNDKNVSKAFETISKYTYNQSNIIDDELQRIGFIPPNNISRNEWNKFPTIRKIEWAYLSAEKAHPSGGEKMLAILSQSLAQQYESIGYSPEIKKLLGLPKTKKISFASITTIPSTSNLPVDFKKAIATISKYTDGDALGGLNNILTSYFDISESEAFEIQRNSRTQQEALEKGISKFEDANVQRNKIKNVVSELHKTYESSRYESSLEPFKNDLNFPDAPPTKSPPPSPKKPSGGFQPKTTTSEYYSKTSQYKDFMRKEYSKPSNRTFRKMKLGKGGFGGVIFGSAIAVDKKLPALDSMLWLPTNIDKPQEIGTLVFKYKTKGFVKYVRDLKFEDVYAAYNLTYTNYDSLTNFKEGNGIGLASLSYGQNTTNGSGYSSYDNKSKREILIHPALANLNIGWSLIYSDIAPIIQYSILNKIRNEIEKEKARNVLGDFGDWKVTDVPLFISFNEDELVVKNNQRPRIVNSEEIYFSMVKLLGKDICDNRTDSTSFNSIAPILYKYDYNYKRINDFAKVFALFRYAKLSKSKISKLPEFNDYILQPHYIALDSTGVTFERPLDEGENWGIEITNKFNDFSNSTSTSLNQEIINYYDSLIKANRKVNDSIWKRIDSWYYMDSSNKALCLQYKYNSLESYFKMQDLRESYLIIEDSIVKYNSKLQLQKSKIDSTVEKITSIYKLLQNEQSIKANCSSIYNAYEYLKYLYKNDLQTEEQERALLAIILREEGCSCGFYKDKMQRITKLQRDINPTETEYYNQIDSNKELVLLKLLIGEEKALSFILSRTCPVEKF
ncbi:hypothetical protein [Foetidibacter luteolus]|uniref:hypothetical protein n=1 Tax=Foetidibacter luteolus TaxID=2608880 RepID=UPI00129A168E|nr:hypothetical protein [Foetidibacter luteolus]